MSKILGILLLALALPLGACADHGRPAGTAAANAPAAKPPQKIVSVEGITEYRLDNGLRVLLFPDMSKPTVTVNVTYLVGSRHEGYGESGMAHLLEHLMFKGTASRDNILAQLETRGAFSNGSTTPDRTNYFEVLPAIPGNLQFALEMEADRMVHSRIAKADLDKEFSVVRNEFETDENQPAEILEERMLSSAFLWHNYGKSSIGSRSDIERVPIAALRAFYQRFYQPDNALLILAGKFNEAETLALVDKTFGPIARPTRQLAPTYTVEPVQDGERVVTLRRSGDLSRIGLLYHGVAGADEDFAAERALVHLLTDPPSGRLYQALVNSGLAAGVSGNAYGWAEPSAFDLFATVRAGQPLDKVQAKLLAAVEGLAAPAGANAVRDEEVQRFQAKTLSNFELAMTRSERIGIELSEWAAQGDWRLLFIYRDRVKQLTPERVRRFAARYLKAANRTLGLFIPTQAPERSPLPPLPDVQALVKGYVGEAAAAGGEEWVPSIDNLEKRTERSVLPNGMQVALLAKQTRGRAVKASLVLRYGSEKDLKGKLGAAELLPYMLTRGTRKHSWQQLRDALDRLKAQVRAGDDGEEGEGAGLQTATFHVTTVHENLPAVLGLLAEMLRQPAFRPDEFAALKKERLAALDETRQDPQSQAFLSLLRRVQPWPKDDVRYSATTAEEIVRLQAVTLPEVAGLYGTLFGGSHAQLAIVGDFDAAAVKEALLKELGDWKSPKPYVRIENPFRAGILAAQERIVTPDKEGAMVLIGAGIDARDDDSDYAAAQLVNHVLGSGFKSRLTERLRSKDGLSYGAFSFIQASPLDRNGMFIAGAICAPQNVPKAMAALVEEVERLAKAGIPTSELEEGKKSYLLQVENRMAQDGFIVNQLVRGLFLNRTFQFQRILNDRIAKLSSGELLPVLAKYLTTERMVRVLAGDLDKKPVAN